MKLIKIVLLCAVIALSVMYLWFFVDQATNCIEQREPLAFCIYALAYCSAMPGVFAAMKLHKIYKSMSM